MQVDIDGVRDDGGAQDGVTVASRDNVTLTVENVIGVDRPATRSWAPGRGTSWTAAPAAMTCPVRRHRHGVLRRAHRRRDLDIDGVPDDGGSLDGTTASARDNVRLDVERLIGGSGGDRLTGSDGANTLDGGRGSDIMSGGAGIDTVSYAGRTATVIDDIDADRDDGGPEDGTLRDRVDTDVENLIGGSGNDTLSAVLANRIANVLTEAPAATRSRRGTAPQRSIASSAAMAPTAATRPTPPRSARRRRPFPE